MLSEGLGRNLPRPSRALAVEVRLNQDCQRQPRRPCRDGNPAVRPRGTMQPRARWGERAASTNSLSPLCRTEAHCPAFQAPGLDWAAHVGPDRLHDLAGTAGNPPTTWPFDVAPLAAAQPSAPGVTAQTLHALASACSGTLRAGTAVASCGLTFELTGPERLAALPDGPTLTSGLSGKAASRGGSGVERGVRPHFGPAEEAQPILEARQRAMAASDPSTG